PLNSTRAEPDDLRTLTAVMPLRVSAPSRRSRTYPRLPPSPTLRRVVTWCDWLTRLALGFHSIAGTRSWPSPGSQPGREVPDDHCVFVFAKRLQPGLPQSVLAWVDDQVLGVLHEPDSVAGLAGQLLDGLLIGYQCSGGRQPAYGYRDLDGL